MAGIISYWYLMHASVCVFFFFFARVLPVCVVEAACMHLANKLKAQDRGQDRSSVACAKGGQKRRCCPPAPYVEGEEEESLWSTPAVVKSSTAGQATRINRLWRRRNEYHHHHHHAPPFHFPTPNGTTVHHLCSLLCFPLFFLFASSSSLSPPFLAFALHACMRPSEDICHGPAAHRSSRPSMHCEKPSSSDIMCCRNSMARFKGKTVAAYQAFFFNRSRAGQNKFESSNGVYIFLVGASFFYLQVRTRWKLEHVAPATYCLWCSTSNHFTQSQWMDGIFLLYWPFWIL